MATRTDVGFRAFLSYSHKDREFAAWLHRRLEAWRIARDLVGTDTQFGKVPKSLRPIFRDREDFSAGASLTESTERALDGAKFLVVICSPNAADSQWVNEEIRRFKMMGRGDRVIPIIWRGEPGVEGRDPFPAALRYEISADGTISNELAHPIAADARESADGRELALQKVVSGLLGVSLDEIRKRAIKAQRRKIAMLTGVAVTMTGLAVLAAGLGWLADQRRAIAERNFNAAKTAADSLVFDVVQGLRETEGVRTDALRQILATAQASYEKLVRSSGDDPKLQRSQLAMYVEMVKTFVAQGDVESAGRVSEQALALAEKSAGDQPTSKDLETGLAVGLMASGDVQRRQGNTETALRRYELALSKLTALKLDPGKDQSGLGALTAAHIRLGDVLKEKEQFPSARTHYQSALAISKDLASRAGFSPLYLRDNAVAMDRLGDIENAQGNEEKALSFYRRALWERTQAGRAADANAELLLEVSISHSRIGDVLNAKGDIERSQRHFLKNYETVKRLIELDPNNTSYQSAMASALDRLGDVLAKDKDHETAGELLLEAVRIRQALVTASPQDATRKRQFLTTLIGAGHHLVDGGAAEKAVAALQLFDSFLDPMLGDADSGPDVSLDIAKYLNVLGVAHSKTGNPGAAINAHERQVKVLKTLAELKRDEPKFLISLSGAHEQLAELLASAQASEKARHHKQRSVDLLRRATSVKPDDVALREAYKSRLSELQAMP